MSLAGSLIAPAIRLPADYGRFSEFVGYARELEVAGFIVFGGDSELTPPFLQRLVAEAGRPLLIMADYEYGAGRMVEGMPELPPAMAIGASRSPEAAYMAGKITALSARAIGVNVVLAPVMDVLSHLGNPIIGTRALSEDPDIVIRLGLAFIEGVQEEGVIACAKHYPGHGDTSLDSHTALPRVKAPRDVLDRRELVPFEAAAKAGVGMMMTAHVVYDGLDPGVPATFSRPAITGLLREKWGYGGIVVTDALVMEGAKGGDEDPAVRAVAAGVDLLLYPEDPAASAKAIEDAVDAGRLDEESLVHARGRLALAAADQVCDAPAARDLTREYGFWIKEIASRALTPGPMRDDLVPAFSRLGPRARILGLVLDDDERPERGRAFNSHEGSLLGGVVHITREGIGRPGGLADALRDADLLVMGLFSDVRAGKESTGLCAPLLGFGIEVLREHAKKTVVVVFGNPGLIETLPARNVLYAYGDDAVSVQVALEAVLSGGAMPGTLPVTVGKDFTLAGGEGTMGQ